MGYVFISVMGILHSTNILKDSHNLRIAQAVSGVFFYIWGFSGLQSNIVQFGLDQMLDASSEELSLFLHWFVWTKHVGELLPRFLFSGSACSAVTHQILGYSSLLFLALSTVCLLLVCCKHHWFNCENVGQTPYWNVYRVLKFATKYGRPLRHRSALTYSDDVRPSRLDFAKQKYSQLK